MAGVGVAIIVMSIGGADGPRLRVGRSATWLKS
jgi:hypothetical protein